MSRRETQATTTEPEMKKRTVSDGVLAGRLFERLDAIDAEEAAELAQAPSDIRAKHEARRAKARSEVSKVVLSLVDRMRGEDDDVPRSG